LASPQQNPKHEPRTNHQRHFKKQVDRLGPRLETTLHRTEAHPSHHRITNKKRRARDNFKEKQDKKLEQRKGKASITTTMTTSTSTIVPTTLMQIPCCLCGTMIAPNAANQCTNCLAQQFDLKGVLQGKSGDMLLIKQCRQCRKYARTDTCWEACEPESNPLLSICMKHIPALKAGSVAQNQYQLQLVDAIWVWTEPNNMRLKLRLTVRAVLENVPVQQRVLVEFIVKFHQCPDCNREYTNRTWQALVQLRQRRDNGAPRKGLAALEMALARNKEIRKHVLRIDSCRHGLDFYFLTQANAQSFAQFLSRLAPMRLKTTQKMVSEDLKNNTANMKHTFACDMVPLCRHDLILVPKSGSGGGTSGNSNHGCKLAGRLCVVTKVARVIHLMDASPKRTIDMDQYRTELSADAYYRGGGDKTFPVLQTSERMVRFVVLDVELIGDNPASSASGTNDDEESPSLYQGPNISSVEKYALADVQVARESDLGSNDTIYNCVSHLGHLLQPGDVVLGYDLVSTASTLSTTHPTLGVVDIEQVLHSNFIRPDVVLVHKVHEASTKSQKKKNHPDDGDDDDDAVGKNFRGTGSKKKLTKKKERRNKKQDKRKRELAERAARMGFLGGDEEDDDVEQHLPPPQGESDDDDDFYENGEDGAKMTNINWDDRVASNDFASQLENDPELAAELQLVEQELVTMELQTKNGPTTTSDSAATENQIPTEETSEDNNGEIEAN
jgi:nonsense-mediated mRNA decay protein 3